MVHVWVETDDVAVLVHHQVLWKPRLVGVYRGVLLVAHARLVGVKQRLEIGLKELLAEKRADGLSAGNPGEPRGAGRLRRLLREVRDHHMRRAGGVSLPKIAGRLGGRRHNIDDVEHLLRFGKPARLLVELGDLAFGFRDRLAVAAGTLEVLGEIIE